MAMMVKPTSPAERVTGVDTIRPVFSNTVMPIPINRNVLALKP